MCPIPLGNSCKTRVIRLYEVDVECSKQAHYNFELPEKQVAKRLSSMICYY